MRVLLGLGLLAALAGCSTSESPSDGERSGASPALHEVAEQSAAQADAKDAAAPGALKISLPQLAYSYALSFMLPGERIAETQDAHRRLCAQMGAARCQLVALQRGGGAEQSSAASLSLRVATSDAPEFESALGRTVADAGGRALDTQVDAEDVSKQIVDAEARIRQRELLVARLTEMLRTRSGKVSELLEAERNVAKAQEELDQARGWIRELRGRVAMSDFEIRYAAIAPTTSPESVTGQIGEAITGSGAVFLIGLRTLLTLAIYILPWASIGLALLLGLRALARRRTADQQG